MFCLSYRDFCVFVKPTCFTNLVQVRLMLLSFNSQVLFAQILVCCMTNICNMFLDECWRLETSSRPFCDFIEMAIQQALAIFNG